MHAVDCVAALRLSDAAVAAGFVRNLVWDALHELPEPTPLNDVDVVYFDATEDEGRQHRAERQLHAAMTELNWQVRNQAIMHRRNGDRPYRNTLDAMRFWPEQETAVGVRRASDGGLDVVAAFGLESLFALQLTPNPARDRHVFEQRLAAKRWLERWPRLQVMR